MGAGGSARREYEQIRDGRVRRVRDNRGVLLAATALMAVGGAVAGHVLFAAWWFGALVGIAVIASHLAPSQREAAWRKGAEGEEAVGRALDGLGGHTRTLHDRRMPGSRANIDHILVTPTGVWTIDAKNYSGKLETRGHGQQLWIGGRNRSKLLDQARGQADAVRQTLAAAGLETVAVTPVLCMLGIEWPLLLAPSSAGDVRLVSVRGLRKLAAGSPTLTVAQVRQVSEHLDARLRPATAPRPGKLAVPNTRTLLADQPATAEPAAERHGGVVVKPWKRYGKHRLYVNRADGTTLGHVDLTTNEVVAVEASDRETVREAAARHLRES